MSEMKPFHGCHRSYGNLVHWACCLCLGAGLMISGCASAPLSTARSAFYNGEVTRAAEVLAEPNDIRSRDRLLYYMEKGTILHYDKDYPASADVLLKAAELIKQQEVVSASQQTVSLVTSEWLTDYKGEYAERLLVHTYQMMNFLLLGRPESALVEAKQALEVYDTYPEACEQDYFSRALIAHCFEALNEINGAYIEYKKLAELMGDPTPVADKLCRLGGRLGFYDEVEHFRQFLPDPEAGNDMAPVGEVLIFLSRGRAPVKVPQDIFITPTTRFSFSTYENRPGYSPGPDIGPLSGPHRKSRVTTDVGTVLRASLDRRLAKIIAKETARVVAKEAIANNIGDSGVESLVRVAFMLMEVPDTRGWETLPGSLTLVRFPLFPGDSPPCPGEMGIPVPETGPENATGNQRFYHYYVVRH